MGGQKGEERRRPEVLQLGFSASRVLSPVCCFESCDLDTDWNREGRCKQFRLWRI
jgi:hypothetical protein